MLVRVNTKHIEYSERSETFETIMSRLAGGECREKTSEFSDLKKATKNQPCGRVENGG